MLLCTLLIQVTARKLTSSVETGDSTSSALLSLATLLALDAAAVANGDCLDDESQATTDAGLTPDSLSVNVSHDDVMALCGSERRPRDCDVIDDVITGDGVDS